MTASPPIDTYDCLVLSGGGAKGAYGAGVAKGLEEFRRLKGINSKLCLIGTSAGALNASMLADGNADNLISFWRGISDKKVLNVKIPTSPKIRALFNAALGLFGRDRAYSVYSNKALAELISKAISLAKIRASGRSLVITATNYTTGRLHSYYVSSLIEQLIVDDRKRPIGEQRLGSWQKLDDDEHLHASLLASSAIPFAFPPVTIDDQLYIDGGIGNHTPTREAAYFLRHVAATGRGQAGEVFCVTQDPPRTLIEGEHNLGPLDILLRTFDVYHYVHTKPIITGWFRINKEVETHRAALEKLKLLITTLPLGQADATRLLAEIDSGIGKLGGATARGDYSMTIIQPSSDLGDTLNFDRNAVDQRISRGYTDMIQALLTKGRIDDAEHERLCSVPVLVDPQ